MSELLDSLLPYLDKPDEYRQFDPFTVLVKSERKEYKVQRYDFIRRHKEKNLKTYLRVDFSAYYIHRVELRMEFKILGITFHRTLYQMKRPNAINEEVSPYITRATTILSQRRSIANAKNAEYIKQDDTNLMTEAVRRVINR